jgi:hypothetical protein
MPADHNPAEPRLTREAPLSFDPKTNRLTVTFSTGAAVRRRDYYAGQEYVELLTISPEAVDLSRLNSGGAPVLNTHASYDLADILGVVEAARIERGAAVADIRLTDRPEVAGIVQDIAGGISRNVSVGYVVNEWTITTATEDQLETRTATRWTPYEISLVAIPADPGAMTRAAPLAHEMRQATMTTTQTLPPPAQAERTRVSEIMTFARLAGLPDTWAAEHIDAGTDSNTARERALAAVKANATHRVHPVAAYDLSHNQTFDNPAFARAAMAEALAARVTREALSQPARAFAGASLVDIARTVLEHDGGRSARQMAPAEVVRRALSTSDFPLLLGSAMSRVLQQRLAAAPGAARAICGRRDVPDFRPGKFLQFAGIADLAFLPEGGEISASPPAERGEGYQVVTFARQAPFTRQAIVNNDLGAFDQMSLFANAVVATEGAEFVKMFATNGDGWGPTLADGSPLFHSSRSNVASGTVGTGGISAGRIAMRAQKDASGTLISPEPRLILVGPAGETAAEQALVAVTAVATTEANRPVFAGRLQHVVEPRLSGAPWFMFADPLVQPVIAMVFLEGTGGNPVFTEHTGPDYDGVVFKITHDFCIAPMSFVGAVRITGS